MSFWDDIDTGWNAVNNAWNATIGGALSYAENIPIFGNVVKFGEAATNDVFAPVDTALSYGVARPLSTAIQVGQSWDTLGHAFTDPNDWRNAWNRSESISPGQAAVIDANANAGNKTPGIGTFDMDPQSVAARSSYFSQGGAQLASGVVDLVVNLDAPAPLKAAKYAAIKRVTFASNAERDAALAVARGEDGAATSGRTYRLGQNMRNLVQSLQDKTEAQIANHPLFFKADNGGALAYFLGRMNREIPDIGERTQAQLDILAAATGNQDALAKLAEKRSDLQNELNYLNSPPQSTIAASSMAARDGGASVIQTMNQRGLLSLDGDFYKSHVENQLYRHDALLSGQVGIGTIGRTKGTWKEAVGSSIRQSEILGGLGSRPIRVVTGAFLQRVPGVIDTKNPVAGYDQLQTYLRNAYWVQADERDRILRSFQSAVTPQDRAAVANEAEETVVARTAKQYGIPQNVARQMLQAGRLRSAAYRDSISSELFSTAGDAGVVKVLDAETGAEHVYDRPLLQTQIQNSVALPNPRQLDADFRRLKKHGSLDTLGADGLPIDDGTSTMGSLANATLNIYTRAWKDAALFRGAYPMRIQVDDQARNLAFMGPMAYFAGWGHTRKAIQAAMSKPDGDRMLLRDLFKGNTDEVINQSLKDLGIEDENIQAVRNAVMARGGTIADLFDESSKGLLNRYQGSGNWAPMAYNQTGWVPAYKRAVLQVQHSPTGRAVARGLQGEDLRAFVMGDQRARDEWRDLRRAQNNDFDGWLGKVERHVNTLLPDEYLRARVSGVSHPELDQHLSMFSESAGAPEDHALGQSFTVKPDESMPGPSGAQHKYSASVRDSRILGADGNLKWATGPRDVQALGKKYGLTDDKPIPVGVLALRRLSVAGFQRYTKMLMDDPKAFQVQATKEFGSSVVDFTKMTDPMQMLDAFGKLKADASGFHSIWDEAGGRYHALKNNGVQDSLPDIEALAKQPLTDGEIGRAFPNGNGAPLVHGESYSPYDKTSSAAVIGAAYNKFRTGFYRIAAESPENVLSRFPLYVHIYKKEVKRISNALKDENGNITDEMLYSAKQSADRIARRQVGHVLFDMSNTSNLAHTMRFVSPFFGAWEDTMRKWWQLSYDKPWVPVYASMAWHLPNNLGMVHDENGNEIEANGSVKDPETGRILDPVKDAGLIGRDRLITIPAKFLPASLYDALGIQNGKDPNGKDLPGFSIPAKSLDVILGNQWWNPGAGPLVQVPVNEFIKHIWTNGENNRPVVNFLLGGQGVDPNGPIEQQIPGWWRQIYNAFGSSHDYANAYKNIAAYEQSQFDQGKRKDAPTPDEVMWKTRMLFILKAGTTFGSPVSIRPDQRGQFYIDEYHKYRANYGPNSPNPNVDGDQKFYQDFPGWFAMTATINANETGIVATLDAKDEANKYKDVILKHPELGWAFTGPANQYGNADPRTAYSSAANSYLTAEGFRGSKDPWAAVKDAEVQKGWLKFQSGQTAFNLAMEAQGVTSLQESGAEDLAQAHKNWIQGLMQQNPDWAVDYLNTNDGAALNLLNATTDAMHTHPELAKRPDMQALSQYLMARNQIMAELANRPDSTLQAASNADLREIWLNLNQSLVQNNIGFEQMWNRVLQHDTLQQTITQEV